MTVHSTLSIDLALEHELLGMALLDPSLVSASDDIRPDYFTGPVHGLIWQTLADLAVDGQDVSGAVVASRLGHIAAFLDLGGLGFLAAMVDKAPAVTLWPSVAARLIETWKARRAAEIGAQMALELRQGAPSSPVITRYKTELEGLESIDGGNAARYQPVNFHDITPQPQAWLIKGALPMRGVGFIGGATKAGKSFLALDTTLRLAAGAPKILSRKARQCGCVYIAAEDPEGCKYRVKAWEAKYHRQTAMPFDLICQSVNLLDDMAVVDLKRTLKCVARRFHDQGSRLGVIVVDTLSRCLSGADENSSTDMGRVFDVLAEISRATDALVLVVAHYGKSGNEKGLRGHSSLDANSEATISVERSPEDSDLRIVTLAKVKNGVDGQQLAFRLEPVSLGVLDDDGDEITSCVPVFEPVSDLPVKQRRTRALTAPEQIVLAAIRHVMDNAKTVSLPASIEGQKPWMKAVTRDQVRAYSSQTGLAGDDKPGAVRMRFCRALEGLSAARKIRIEGDLLWLI